MKYSIAVLEITVDHPTLPNQILKMSRQLHIMIRQDDRTSHRGILSYLPCCLSINYVQSNVENIGPKERFQRTYFMSCE